MKEQQPIRKKDLRVFGILFGAMLVVFGLWPLLFRHETTRIWALALAALPLVPAIVFPSLLTWPYRGWVRLGGAIGAVVSRVILGALFFLLFTPVGIARRVLGRDTLSLRFDPNAATYRVPVDARSTGHLERQF